MRYSTAHIRISVLATFTLGSLLACTAVDDGGAGSSGGTAGGVSVGGSIATGGASAGGAPATGGTAGGPGCGDGVAPPRTVLCAGGYWEQAVVTQASAMLATSQAPWACLEQGYYPYPYPYPYDYDCGDECYGDGYEGGSAGAGYGGGTGGIGMGGVGAGGIGTGGIGMGGVGAGGSPAGGTGGGSGEMLSDWCDDLGPQDYVAGVSFAHGACQASELRTPIRFQEPHGFYEVLVYGGDSECDRGELLQEISGYGTGQLIELPAFHTDAAYVSIEVASQGYAETSIELESLGAAREFTEGE